MSSAAGAHGSGIRCSPTGTVACEDGLPERHGRDPSSSRSAANSATPPDAGRRPLEMTPPSSRRRLSRAMLAAQRRSEKLLCTQPLGRRSRAPLLEDDPVWSANDVSRALQLGQPQLDGLPYGRRAPRIAAACVGKQRRDSRARDAPDRRCGVASTAESRRRRRERRNVQHGAQQSNGTPPREARVRNRGPSRSRRAPAARRATEWTRARRLAIVGAAVPGSPRAPSGPVPGVARRRAARDGAEQAAASRPRRRHEDSTEAAARAESSIRDRGASAKAGASGAFRGGAGARERGAVATESAAARAPARVS